MAMTRCALLEMIGAGAARGTVVDRYPVRIEPIVLKLRRNRIAGLLGLTMAVIAVGVVLYAQINDGRVPPEPVPGPDPITVTPVPTPVPGPEATPTPTPYGPS